MCAALACPVFIEVVLLELSAYLGGQLPVYPCPAAG